MAQSADSAELEQDVSSESSSSTDTELELLDIMSTDEAFLETFASNEEGERELLLVPCKNSRPSDPIQGSQDDHSKDQKLFNVARFSGCISAIKCEPAIQRSPRGKEVIKILDYLEENMNRCTGIISSLYEKVHSCLLAAKDIGRPSTAQSIIWSKFHQLRCSETLQQLWKSVEFPETLSESELAFQIISDRLLKQMITDSKVPTSPPQSQNTSLTIREKNVIRYMAGYVALSLTRKYSKGSNNVHLQEKWKLYLCVLRNMRVYGPFESVGCVDDYTRIWTELIDRGGLYHIDDKAYFLMEEIELISRRFLNIPIVLSSNVEENVTVKIQEAVLKSDQVLQLWEKLAQAIPPHYEPYSNELLINIVDLWVSIRGHSFAKIWSMKTDSKFKKATRKTLKKKSEE